MTSGPIMLTYLSSRVLIDSLISKTKVPLVVDVLITLQIILLFVSIFDVSSFPIVATYYFRHAGTSSLVLEMFF